MCGRFTLSCDQAELIERFQVDDVFMETALTPRFNIAPSQSVAAVVALSKDGKRVLTSFQWGLIPFFVKEPAKARPMINARAETLAEKPFFKTALLRRRCLIPADGFYEWRTVPGTKKKQPLWIHLKGESSERAPLFAFAGLYDKNEHILNAAGEPVKTCTIITTEANESIKPVHDRMPVILGAEGITLWLDPSVQDPAQLSAILQPLPANVIAMFPVSTRVNSPAYDGKELILPDPTESQ